MQASFLSALLHITLLACLLISQVAVVNAQQPTVEPDDVIRLDTNLVQVRAVVTDRKGQLVDNLKQEDFEVLENGQPQQISFFAVERLPGNVSGQRADGQRPAQGVARTRSIGLFVDTVHMTPNSLFRAQQQLRRFVDEMMTDRDSVAIISTSGNLGILQQFTSDRRMLRYAIDRLTPFLMKSFTLY